ncbi:MAG: NTP transferase domain-containing protein [Candidatus Aegiribacteria sp.]|nr:NTP transferase domain-containing protein [Candidatus Aegiribacteria sp.]
MESSFFAVIMAGGRGTRFWPVSTGRMPKQFLRLTGSMTMLQETAVRFEGLCGHGDIMVVTGSDSRSTVIDQLPWISENNLLLEPSGRNTAACIGWAAKTLIERGRGSDLMVVVPSDHVIDNPDGFRNTLLKAAIPAADGKLVTIGVTPDRPATGYGYLEKGKCHSEGIYDVSSFREKPNLEEAEEYLENGDYFWNAGMFIWRADVIMKEIARYLPELSEGLRKLGTGTCPDQVRYDSLQSVSIDFGVMEKADNVVSVPAQFGWNDIGDWPSARRCGVGRGEVLAMDSVNTTVWNDGKLTVLLGVSDVSVVETDSVTLIMSDEYSQKLREVVADLEDTKPDLV